MHDPNLVHVVAEVLETITDECVNRYDEQATMILDELVRASTVTTEAELNALPEGALIESGTFILRHRRRIKQWQQVMRTDGEPCHPYDMEPADVPVPATVLFRPV